MIPPLPVVHVSVPKDKNKMLMKPEETQFVSLMFLISRVPSLTFNENDGAADRHQPPHKYTAKDTDAFP